MAAKKKATSTKSKSKAKKAPEVDEIEELELEELDEDEEVEEKPKAKKKAKSKKSKKAEKTTWGTRELAEYIAEEIGNEYSTKELRVLLRKMAKEGELDWEVSQGSGSRYEWDGPDDPEVQAILERVQGGEIEEARAEALEKLKESQAKKRAASKKGSKKKTSKKSKKAAEEDEEELEDDEELEFDEDEDDE